MSHRLRDPRFLVSRWNLSGNAEDSMGRYPGTLVNDPTWGSFYKNDLQAIELDGNDQYVNCGNIPELNTTLTEFGFSLWIKLNNNLAVFDNVLGKSGPAGNRGWRLGIDTDESLDMKYWNNAAGTLEDTIKSSAGAIIVDQWHHVAFSFKASICSNLFIDGILVDSGTPLTILNGQNNQFVGIGSRGDTTTLFDGCVSDVRIYNIPLTQDEILKIIHAPVPTY